MSYPILKPNSSWFTPTASTITRSTITLINIVDSYIPSTTPIDFWDASVAQDGGIMCYVEDTVLTIAGNGSGRIQANEDSSFMFSDIDLTDYFTALTALNNLSTIDFSTATNFKAIFRNCLIVNLDVSGIDTSNVTTFHSAFRQCSNLVTLDLSSWDASKCENLYAMFYKCSALTEVNVTGWNTPNLTTVDYLFDQCTKLQRFDATALNAAKLTTMYGMFQNCSPLTELDVSGWDTSNVINMSFAFWGCKGLTRLDVENWNVSNVENFDHLFAHCNNLVVDVTNWKTSSKCKYYTAMFHTNANEYLDVSGFDTSGAVSMALMFEANVNLKKIKGLENFDTSNVASFEEMFFNCWNLEELDLSSFDTRKADTVTPVRSDGQYPSECTQRMLSGCRSLKKITLGENFTFAGDGTATGDQIGTLPAQKDTYIDGADGNWYTLDGTTYAPADIPNLTAATYYASPIIVKEAIWERDSKKYMHLSAMKTYQNLQNIAIDSKMNELKKTFLAKNQDSANVGKILVVGTDGNLTLADMPEGYTPQKGVDYWTTTDKEEIVDDVVSSVVVQKAGESESLVMSQKAVTEALGNKLDVSASIDPSWGKWQDIRYSYGFNPNTQPIFNSVKGTLESDTMVSVRGGKGRWGWHNFEGWSPNELSRLTMLMGKHHETFGYIQTFSPNGLYADRNRWGWVKIGCDELNEGTDFSKNWATCYTPITLAPQAAPSYLADYDLNPQFTSNAVPVGTMYFDAEEQRIKIYTKTGWQPIAFVGEGGGGSGGEEEFYEPIPSYKNGCYVEVETSKIVPAGSNGRLAAFRLNKNTNYTVTRSALSARFRIYLYYNTSLDDAIEKGAVGTLIAQDSSHTSLSTLSFTNTDFAMAVVMLSNKGDTTTTITAEIIE